MAAPRRARPGSPSRSMSECERARARAAPRSALTSASESRSRRGSSGRSPGPAARVTPRSSTRPPCSTRSRRSGSIPSGHRRAVVSSVWLAGRCATRAAARRRVELAEHVVEEQHRLGADDVGDDPVPASRSAERERALLALRRVRARVEPVEHGTPVVAVRADERDAPVDLARAALRARRAARLDRRRRRRHDVAFAPTRPRTASTSPVAPASDSYASRTAGVRRSIEAQATARPARRPTRRAARRARRASSGLGVRGPARSSALRCFSTRS